MAKVKTIMTAKPACCTPDAGLQEVAGLMCEHNCGEIPIVENRDNLKPIGVITDRDIACRAVAKGKNPLELRAKDCMTSPCLVVAENTSLEACCELMEEHQVRRLPVIDSSNRLCGIISQADIALKAPPLKIAEVVQRVSQATA